MTRWWAAFRVKSFKVAVIIYRHHWLLLFCTTFIDLAFAWGSQDRHKKLFVFCVCVRACGFVLHYKKEEQNPANLILKGWQETVFVFFDKTDSQQRGHGSLTDELVIIISKVSMFMCVMEICLKTVVQLFSRSFFLARFPPYHYRWYEVYEICFWLMRKLLHWAFCSTVSTNFFLTCHSRHCSLLPFCTTFCGLDLGQGTQSQQTAKPVGFISTYIFLLIRIKFDLQLKQSK